MEEELKKEQGFREDLTQEHLMLRKRIIQLKKPDSQVTNQKDLDVEEVKDSSGKQQRGNTDHLPPSKRLNVVLTFGCKPSSGINYDSLMVENSKDALETRFDKKKLTLEIPKVFEFLQGTDVDFEMVTSSTLQNLELAYKDNIVAESHAYVFQTD